MLAKLRVSGGALALLSIALWPSVSFAQTTVTRTSSFAYDSASGLLTQEVIEPDTSALRLQTDYTYNAFGHKVTVTVSGVDITTRGASTTYDSKGQFAVSASNALSHGESFEYDARFGAPTKHTGPNGLVTTWSYDDFGRKVLEVRADGTQTTWSYQFCSGTAGGSATCPTGGAYLIQVKVLAADGTTQIGPTATAYHDKLNRVIAADTEGFDGSLIRAATEYDALGRIAKKSRPYFVSGGTPVWTTFTYDELGRVLTETAPNTGVTTNTYKSLVSTSTNALSQKTTTTKNSQGQIVLVEDNQSHTTAYEYDPFGNLTKVADAAGNITTSTYDTRGRKTASNDPDMGASTYTYDVLDKLKTHTNAASEVTTLSYDLLGRMTQRVEPGLTSDWIWDTATKGVGKLASATTSASYSRVHSYDSLGRPTRVDYTINSASYAITAGYDSVSRIASVTYPSGFAVSYVYNAFGYQSQIKDSATSKVLWTANARDAELHLTQQTFGNGIVTTQLFDGNTGQLTDIAAGNLGAVQGLAYTYDVLGKLLTRSDANTSLAETFTYDTLNRLTSSTVSLSPTPLVNTFNYNTIGNLISKSDVGVYAYPNPGQPRPHGVTSISGGVINTTFSYDAKGNMTAGNGLTVTYTSFNKPATITRGTTTVSFNHDPEQQRYRQTTPSGVMLYLSGGGVMAERFAGSGGSVRWTNYLTVAGQLVGVYIEKSDETTLTRYFHLDHLGSVSVITDENGLIVERLSYDAWGLRRNPDGTPDTGGSITSEASRGFTGHEHLAEVGLIHMNGRVYDPLLARFGTPDPMTENPFSTQGWNRYSYVGNSPVNFTDPSGYCFLGCFWKPMFKAIGNFLRQSWRAIVQIAVTALVCTGPLAPVCAGVISAAVTGLASGDLGLALKAGFISMATAFAMQAVGDITSSIAASEGPQAARLFNVAGHAAVGCGASVAQGQSCGSGAAAGAIGSVTSGLTQGMERTQALVVHSVAGGLASAASGGKFANGAVTAAFGYLFNQMAHDEKGNAWGSMPPVEVDRNLYRQLQYNLTDPWPIGSALKPDFDHYAPTFFRTETAVNGTLFFIERTADPGNFSSLWQYPVPGGLRGQPGIVEYILDPWWSNTLTHQRFIPGGTLTGFPNQKPKYLPGPKN